MPALTGKVPIIAIEELPAAVGIGNLPALQASLFTNYQSTQNTGSTLPTGHRSVSGPKTRPRHDITQPGKNGNPPAASPTGNVPIEPIDELPEAGVAGGQPVGNQTHTVAAARQSLPAAGSIPTASAGGALPGSASERKKEGSTTLALQWNINGFFNNLGELETLVQVHCPLILAIQEVHRASEHTMNRTLAGQYSWTLSAAQTPHCGAAIGVKADLPFTPVMLNTDLIAAAVRIELPIPITVVSIYLTCQPIPDLGRQLIDLFDSLDSPLLVLGDANGHHQEWGSRFNNQRGIDVLEAATATGLTPLNDGSITFTCGVKQTAIDTSFASLSLVHRLLWRVMEDPMGSDHHPIIIRTNDRPPEASRRPRWNYKQADWKHFLEALAEAHKSSVPGSIDDLTRVNIGFKGGESFSDGVPRPSHRTYSAKASDGSSDSLTMPHQSAGRHGGHGSSDDLALFHSDTTKGRTTTLNPEAVPFPLNTSSQRTVGSDANKKPELVDNPWHPGRGTNKETCFYSASHSEGLKLSLNEAKTELQELAFVPLAGSSVGPFVGGAPPTLGRGSKMGDESVATVSKPLRRSERLRAKFCLPTNLLSNAAAYDQLQVQRTVASLPTAGPSLRPSPDKSVKNLASGNPFSTTAQNQPLPTSPLPRAAYTKLRPRQCLTGSLFPGPLFAIQWNVNGFFHNLSDLEILVRDYSPSVLAIQEVHRASTEWMNRSLAGQYHWILRSSQNIYHTTAIGIRLPLPFTVIPLTTDLPIVAVRLQCPIQVTIVSAYLPCRKIPDLKSKLSDLLKLLEGPIILMGDVNGHHPAWG